MKFIKEEFEKSGLILDKTTQPLTALPFDVESLKLKSNSYVNYETFNNILEKLHHNLMYLYRGCNIGSFKMFRSYSFTLSSSSVYPYFVDIENGYTSIKISNPVLSGSELGAILPFIKEKNGNYVFFSDRKFLTCVFAGKTSTRFVFNTNNIDPLSGDIKYKDISDIKTDNTENLYIIDSSYNNVYQFNIKNFISDENIYREKLFIKNFIGGIGEVKDNNKFKKIKNLAVNNNFIVVQDSGDKCFKIFDKNLKWLGTNVFVKVFKKYNEFSDLVLDEDNNLFCCSERTIVVFNLSNNSLSLKGEIKIEQYLEYQENIKKLALSPSNNKIIYLVTNKSVKKAWTTNISFLLGEFKYNTNEEVAIKWLSLSPLDENVDVLAIYSLVGSEEQFSFSLDSLDINTILNSDNFLIYSKEDILIKSDEYVQSWVILKNLQKVYYNLFILIQNIKYKFLEAPNLVYPVIKEKIYNTAFLGFSNSLNFEDNFNIGVNEIFQADVINRSINELVNLQTIILIYILNNKNETVYYSPNPELSKITIREYIYFVDDSLISSPNPSKLDIFEEFQPGGGLLTSLGGAPYTGIQGITITEGVNI